MKNKNLYISLLFLASKLEEIKSNPMQDKHFVTSLTEVLKYFRDNGELKEAFKINKNIVQDIEKQPFCKAIMDMFCAKITTEHPEFPPFNLEETLDSITSDKYIENKINQILD